jgi:hypothetical protein
MAIVKRLHANRRRRTLDNRSPWIAPATVPDHASLQGIVLDVSRTPLSRDHLHERLNARIRSWLAATCDWEPRTTVGRFRALAFTFAPAPGVNAFVQFWCEPNRPVWWEVCSGRTDEPTRRWLGPDRAERIRAFGFEIGGDAEFFRMPVVIRSPEDIALVAHSVVEILYAALDYRGDQPLHVELDAGIHVPTQKVFGSLTPIQIAEALAEHGYAVVSLMDDAEAPVLLFRRLDVHTTVELSERREGTRSFQTLAFTCNLQPRAEDVARLTSAARVVLPPGVVPVVRLGTTLHLGGGVAMTWIHERVAEWTRMTDQYREEQPRRLEARQLSSVREWVH